MDGVSNFPLKTQDCLAPGFWDPGSFLGSLTPNSPLVHTSFTYRKLNMDGFSVLNGFLGYVDSTQKIFLKFLHAQGLFQTS